MRALIKSKKLSGNLDMISSKSCLHRAIIASSLASGTSVIDNVYLSLDILATIEACRSFGAIIKEDNNKLIIKGSKVLRIKDVVDANESGSTLRFMIPILLTNEEKITFTGHNNLVKRPLDEYFKIFDRQNIKYKHEENYLPLEISGKLKPGKFEIRGDISSQYITGLLMALPLLDLDSEIIITTKLESKSYIDITLDILNKYGIDINNNNYKSFYVKGNQQYHSCDYIAEGDYSQAAFFLTANAFGSNIKLNKMNPNSIQGDKKIIDFLNQFGSKLGYQNGNYYLIKNDLKPAIIDLADTPDLGPILFTLASTIKGESRFVNTKRLKIKESDRILAMQEELEKTGAKFRVLENEVYIDGTNFKNGDYEFNSHNDHRIVMSLAILATILKGNVVINGIEAINKTYPTFFLDYKKLGGEVYE